MFSSIGALNRCTALFKRMTNSLINSGDCHLLKKKEPFCFRASRSHFRKVLFTCPGDGKTYEYKQVPWSFQDFMHGGTTRSKMTLGQCTESKLKVDLDSKTFSRCNVSH